MTPQASLIDLTGRRFGRLIALVYLNRGKWRCRCDCGKIKEVAGPSLRRGLTSSCGCLHLEKVSKPHRHGRAKSKEYRAYHGMLGRCYNPKNSDYHNYGGRGICVCAAWLAKEGGFEAFYLALGPIPSPSHTLDRIDNDKNYEPSNCRWATRLAQVRNRRVSLKDGGITLQEISEATGIDYWTIVSRYRRGDRGKRLRRKLESRR